MVQKNAQRHMCTCMQYWQKKINSISHTHKHTYTNGSQVLWIIQWNKSKHNNICTQIQTTQSSHGLWPSKHTDKEQTTLTDMQTSYTRPHQKVVLVMVLPWLWSVKATKTFGALVRPENRMQKFYAQIALWELVPMPKYYYHLIKSALFSHVSNVERQAKLN